MYRGSTFVPQALAKKETKGDEEAEEVEVKDLKDNAHFCDLQQPLL